ncbi:hypothetical protein [Oceanihabitans sediminis]|uniref:hypothetical protein n=1 Tax=Oceanihabitans sediminis TaxID=1812012 RepID=UPI000B099AF6
MKTTNFFFRYFLFLGLFSFMISCLSDDDTTNTSTQTQIQNTVQSGTWIISNFIDSGNDETGHFLCYSFVFQSDGTLVATSSSNSYNGTWSVSNSSSNDDSSGDLDFNIHFNLSNAFEDLNDDWDIIGFNANSISLIDVSGGNGGTDYLTFVKGTPMDDCSSSTQSTIQDNVAMGTWRITEFIDSGIDETNHFTGYNFSFNSSGVLHANNGSISYNGTWSITDSNSNDDSQDDLDFNIYFNLSNDFEDLNDDWDFISHSPTKIELIDISGGNGGTDYLSFEKN